MATPDVSAPSYNLAYTALISSQLLSESFNKLAVQSNDQTTTWKDYAPLAAGLGAGALTGAGLYKYLRKATPTNNATLRALRSKADDTFTRVHPLPQPTNPLTRALDRIAVTGGDPVYYEPTLEKTNKIPTVKGIVRLPHSDYSDVVKGGLRVGALPKDSSLTDALLKSKWKEYQVFNKYAPGSMGNTLNLAEIAQSLDLPNNPKTPKQKQKYLNKIQTELKKRFPDGFVMKETEGVQSGGVFPNETHHLHDLWTNYQTNKTPAAIRAAEKRIERGENSTKVYRKLRKDNPHYAGRVLDQAFKDPKQVIVQERLKLQPTTNPIRKALKNYFGVGDLSNEMRVHVENGQVVPSLTLPRHAPLGMLESEHRSGANKYVEDLLKKLPKKYKNLTYAMDVSPLESGGYRIIESNPTGNSGFLYPGQNPLAGIQLRRHYLGNYSKPVAGMAATGAGLGAAGLAGLTTNQTIDK